MHLKKTKELFFEKESCQSELGIMRESLDEILKEARLTKDELREMREKIDEETFRDIEYSLIRMNPDPIFNQLLDLKKEIDYINSRLSFTESELKRRSDTVMGTTRRAIKFPSNFQGQRRRTRQHKGYAALPSL